MSDPPILVQAGIDLQPIDESEINQVMRRFERRIEESLEQLESIKSRLDFRVTVEDGELRDAVTLHDDLDADASMKVNVNQGELDTAKRKHGDLDANTSMKVNVDDSDVDNVLDELKTLQTLQAIEIAINIVTNLGGVIEQLESIPGVAGIVEGEAAGALVAGRTELTPEQGTQLTGQIFEQNFGETRQQVAEVVAELARADVAFDQIADSAISAFQVASTNGKDVTEVLEAQRSMVESGLVDSYREAGDVLQTSFELGLDKGGELLATYTEYSSSIRELGLSVEEVTNLFDTGLAAGFDNVDRIADLVRETTLRALNPEETAAQDALAALGLADETAALRAGEITGGEFLNGVRQALLATEDAGQRQALATAIFGTQAEDFGLQAALALDPVNQVFDTFEGRAASAAEEFNNTLAATVNEFFRAVDGEATRFLSSEQIGLDEKLAAIREGLESTLSELQGGATLGEAIERGFQIEGFDENLDRLESLFGNFVLMLGDIAITFAEFTRNTQLADSIRDAMRPLAEAQLAFDLQLANEAQVETAVSAALRRGVDQADVGAAISTAIGELRAENNFGQIGTILEGALSSGLFTGGAQGSLQAMADQVATEAENAFTAAFSAGDFNTADAILENIRASEPELAAGMEVMLINAFNTAMIGHDFGVATAIAEQLDDPTVTTRLQNTVTEWTAIIEAELAAGNYREALDAARILGDVDLVQQALEGLRNTVFQPSGGAGAPSGSPTIGPTTSGNIAGGTVFDQAIAAVHALEQAFTEKQPIVSTEIGTIKTGLIDLDESSAVNLTTISENFALFAGQIDAEISRVDPRLHGVQEDITNIKLTSEADLPLANESIEAFVARVLEGTDPLMDRIEAIVLGFGDVIEVSNGLPGVGGGGSGADNLENRDVGGWVHEGGMYMVNGEPFLAPGDALALGLDAGSNLMGLFSGGGGSTTNIYNTTNVQVQQSLHAQSTAQAISAGDRFASTLRGF